LLVTLRKLGGNLVQQLAGAFFGERHDSGDDPGYPLRTTRTKGPEEDPGLVRMEYCGGAFEMHGYRVRLFRGGDRFSKTPYYVLR
jgi:hypothetical protein